MEIDAKASKCPHCQSKIYVWTTGRKILAGLLGLIVLMIIIGSSSHSSSTSSTATTQNGHSNIEVCVEAQHLIGQFLKSPSTAKFPTCNDTTITKVSDDKYTVSAYVDSQNSYGAMLRSDWSLTYHYTNGGANTQLDLVTIDGKTMYGGN